MCFPYTGQVQNAMCDTPPLPLAGFVQPPVDVGNFPDPLLPLPVFQVQDVV
jgi:hypothetical protein